MNWAERVSPTVRSLPPSGIRRFFDIVAEMKGVVSLGVGEPDFITPWHIRESSIHGLHKGYTAYTSNFGLLELREEIARLVYNEADITYDPRREILITVGVSEGLDLAMRALLCPGDEVLVPEPCYVSYKACVTLAGGVPIPVPTSAANEFRVTVEQLAKLVTPCTKALLIGYPNNPTGAVMPKAELEKIARFAEQNDLVVIADEIYAKLTYEGEHTCFASLPGMRDRTILLNGFSKAYAMTGWRIGYALSNPDLIAAMTKIHQYTILCAPVMAQIAAIEALKKGEADVVKMVSEYNARRRFMLEGFRQIGLPCFEPKGAFYLFPSIAHTGIDSLRFAEELLKAEKVALVPGNAFGESGEGFVRCSYATSIAQLSEALERIGRFVRKLDCKRF
ncbi:MAG TPA: aminotransferase class I/II-fold pyridoxal phosphate-dependent enzyme [Methylomusa anaerophila]|uniref:Aminotransferase n=1 Tax=Methylomusa anaerophila TaxID=1930071 RepID=A0A348AHK0_9FIRM|nr:aminotransferase class I/II-fold pyridoxal phosphate-dependent enzyme [Methylomusa anaerophila]BBB90548.1 putative N-acetyl-LL-diaminopimelate aminotransferase [Methylomusa anaerophila]HML88846.1 aminotransferase class I/II-fold pyridoxal phosphate-dependent enzyme [Methylomusa anaerophila]